MRKKPIPTRNRRELTKLRLNVFIARASGLSRRHADTAVFDGRVSLNGETAEKPSLQVGPEDRVTLDGKILALPDGETWIVLNKPTGYITSRSDERGRKTVMELLPPKFRKLFPVGRLDRDTTGVLLFTDDGPAAHRILHPSFETPRKYRALIVGTLSENERMAAKRGVIVAGRRAILSSLQRMGKTPRGEVYEVELTEGRYHEVRLFFKALGHEVLTLERLSHAGITASGLQRGQWRFLSKNEIRDLKSRLERYASK